MLRKRKSIWIYIILTIIISVSLFNTVSFADNTDLTDDIKKTAGEGYRYLLVIGSIVAVVAVAIYGINWFMADSPQQKAALKEKMSIYIIGAILVFGGASVAVWIMSIFVGTLGDYVIPVKKPVNEFILMKKL